MIDVEVALVPTVPVNPPLPLHVHRHGTHWLSLYYLIYAYIDEQVALMLHTHRPVNRWYPLQYRKYTVIDNEVAVVPMVPVKHPPPLPLHTHRHGTHWLSLYYRI